MSARIYSPSKTATQSGASKSKRWLLEYEAASPRTADPLMGWTSSSDMLSQVKLWFETKDEAVAYARAKGLAFRVEEPKQPVRKGMSYTDNFRHNRIGTWTH